MSVAAYSFSVSHFCRASSRCTLSLFFINMLLNEKIIPRVFFFFNMLGLTAERLSTVGSRWVATKFSQPDFLLLHAADVPLLSIKAIYETKDDRLAALVCFGQLVVGSTSGNVNFIGSSSSSTILSRESMLLDVLRPMLFWELRWWTKRDPDFFRYLLKIRGDNDGLRRSVNNSADPLSGELSPNVS